MTCIKVDLHGHQAMGKKVIAVLKIKPPKNASKVQTFLGMVMYDSTRSRESNDQVERLGLVPSK